VNPSVQIRPYPYPARAAFSICNDIDGCAFDDFLLIHRYLNTREATALGDGLGLEIGDSFWMYSVRPPVDDAFTYFDGTTVQPGPEAEQMRTLMQAGYLDVLHTWGNFTGKGGFTRGMAESACEELDRHGIHPLVWVNHDDTVFNTQRLGGRGLGHRPESDSFHADLTLELGVRFVWENMLSSVVGQDRALSAAEAMSFTGIDSLIARPARYQLINAVDRAWFGNKLMHRRPLFPRLDPIVRSFTRYGYWDLPTSDDLPTLLDAHVLGRLVAGGGTMLLYVHLGQRTAPGPLPLSDDSVQALAGLASRAESGELLVTTTSRLLSYVRMRDAVRWSCEADDSRCLIRVDSVRDRHGVVCPATPQTLMGLTFYVPDPARAEVCGPDGERLPLCANPKDYSGRASVSIPWDKLSFPF